LRIKLLICGTLLAPEKQERFTALLHHLTATLLQDSFYALKRQAAPEVGGVTCLKPLDAELLKTPEGREPARKIYRLAWPGYHYIARNTLDAMIGAKLGST
jgi:hypothetical protein